MSIVSEVKKIDPFEQEICFCHNPSYIHTHMNLTDASKQ